MLIPEATLLPERPATVSDELGRWLDGDKTVASLIQLGSAAVEGAEHLLGLPKVKTYARTPASRNSISKVRWAAPPGWRASWYIRGSSTTPAPPASTSMPAASAGGRPSRSTWNGTVPPGGGLLVGLLAEVAEAHSPVAIDGSGQTPVQTSC